MLSSKESIEGILSWRDMKAKEIGLTEVDKRLLMMQKKAQVSEKSQIDYKQNTTAFFSFPRRWSWQQQSGTIIQLWSYFLQMDIGYLRS